jgi:hypothetical protein
MLRFLWDLFVAAVIIAAPVCVLTCVLVTTAELCRLGRRRHAGVRVNWDAELRELIP